MEIAANNDHRRLWGIRITPAASPRQLQTDGRSQMADADYLNRGRAALGHDRRRVEKAMLKP